MSGGYPLTNPGLTLNDRSPSIPALADNRLEDCWDTAHQSPSKMSSARGHHAAAVLYYYISLLPSAQTV
jgi:hypothetical protein